MYKVFFVNFGYYASREGRDLDEARKIAREAGFQATIEHGGKTVATWCSASGFRMWDRSYAA